jgi:hypothetical protein
MLRIINRICRGDNRFQYTREKIVRIVRMAVPSTQKITAIAVFP